MTNLRLWLFCVKQLTLSDIANNCCVKMNWSKWSNHWIAYLPIPMLHNLVWLYDNLNWQPSPWPRLSGTFQEGPNITGSEVFTWQTTLTIMQWFSINQKSSFDFPFFFTIDDYEYNLIDESSFNIDESISQNTAVLMRVIKMTTILQTFLHAFSWIQISYFDSNFS